MDWRWERQLETTASSHERRSQDRQGRHQTVATTRRTQGGALQRRDRAPSAQMPHPFQYRGGSGTSHGNKEEWGAWRDWGCEENSRPDRRARADQNPHSTHSSSFSFLSVLILENDTLKIWRWWPRGRAGGDWVWLERNHRQSAHRGGCG